MWPFQSNNKDKIRDQSDTLEKMSIDINEEELGDPALLAELAGLAINDGNNPDFHGLKNMVDVEGILANIPMDDPDINDVDENDPVLLAELRGLISSDVKNDEQMASVPIPISSKELHGTEVGDDSKNGNPTVEDLAFMLKCSQAEKQLALTKKKTGDTQGALLHLRKSKLLDNRIKELRASKVEQVSEDTILYENSKESNYTTKLPVSEEELSLQNAVSEKLLFSTRHIEYRKAALALKRQNRKEEAQKMLRVSKQIESVLDSITAGNPVTDFVLPGPPVISEGATPGGIKHHDSADIDELIAKLDDQSSHCSELALNFHKAKDKTNAALFLKYRKQMLQDKDTLIRMKEGKQSISYHSEMKEYNYAITMMNNDIPSNTLNIQILRANLVELKTGSWNSSVSYDFGWPSVIESKGETKNVLGPKPEYGFSGNINFSKTNQYQRYFERKKLTLELIQHSTTLFGMLGTKTIVAKASIKLDPLLLKREISQDLQLCDPNNLRKNAGGKIRIVLKLREPFLKPEVSILKKHWICVSFEHPLPDTPQKTKRKETSNEGAINRQTPIMLKPTPDQQQMENLISEFEDPEFIASNQVLENEHATIASQISKLKIFDPTREDLIHLKSSYEVRMQMLVTSIQLGMLDLPSYLNQVKESITKTKEQALLFKKFDQLEYAKKAMIRLKLMTEEVSEAESNL